ncbi:hypothetical protein Kpol_1010p17 [Vanderwaltozyma polyspora DSM 70294]|uniref:Uncharacterized protein n=1 Tax=Vanderwaltozyma polyspora (strain ATCC 22028 / DSM 70294 / BCRC 21397 / CBS 2163 / NBRC 10782 / NRRL Y-8283 / UCD 57-17) TaxID=436907 RepID=A7TIG4_VANPO|nr:uncharacterized protein Kpol_1010p17 [Vanderwaltozyma polyspora DSM 70294]EDO17902.1 hypothetical protein Kpol_1010p17 [Vanderwaltozyma polyspora DSM 70294]
MQLSSLSMCQETSKYEKLPKPKVPPQFHISPQKKPIFSQYIYDDIPPPKMKKASKPLTLPGFNNNVKRRTTVKPGLQIFMDTPANGTTTTARQDTPKLIKHSTNIQQDTSASDVASKTEAKVKSTDVNIPNRLSPTIMLDSNSELSTESDMKDKILKQKKLIEIDLKSLQGLPMKGFSERNAKFYVQFKYGDIKYKAKASVGADKKSLNFSKQVSIPFNEIDDKLTMSLNCQYRKLKTYIEETVIKIPMDKNLSIGKKHYKMQKKFTQKDLEYDPWELIISPENIVGEGEIDLCKIKDTKATKEIEVSLMNGWTKKTKSLKSEPKTSYEISKLILNIRIAS